MNDRSPDQTENSTQTTAVTPLMNGAFTTDARGNAPPFDADTLVFDPGAESVPLNVVANGNQFGNGFRGPLADSRRLVTVPPEGYDRTDGYDEQWPPLTWGQYEAVSGTAEIRPTTDGTDVRLSVQDAVPNGRYTVWAVKFARLSDPEKFNAFVTPNGNALVGFQPLGTVGNDRTEANNEFVTDTDGRGGIKRKHTGGRLTGIPGFRPVDNAPFVAEASEYEQSADRLTRIDGDLREEDEVHFVGAYHYDDQTWGVYPGPYHLNHFAARF